MQKRNVGLAVGLGALTAACLAGAAVGDGSSANPAPAPVPTQNPSPRFKPGDLLQRPGDVSATELITVVRTTGPLNFYDGVRSNYLANGVLRDQTTFEMQPEATFAGWQILRNIYGF